MKKILILFLIVTAITVTLSASLGPNVSQTADGKTLRWEEGSRDYFAMFKSLIEDRHGNSGSPGNPQADSCIDYNTGSTFKLEPHHIPDDAFVEAAYLIWTAAQDPDNMNGPTDNSVTLSFNSRDNSVSLERHVTSSVNGNMNTPPSFEYEAIQSFDQQAGINTGVFTYRVDVTDFMQEIIEEGRKAGSDYDGYSLLGDYNVKHMDCTNHEAYVTRSVMVGDWVLFFVYTSEKIQFPKKIYVYNGLEEYHHEFEDISVTGFELPDEAEMRLTMVVHEGDPGLVNTSIIGGGSQNPESLSLSGAQSPDWIQLTNICNPLMAQGAFQYTEVFNMVSSVYGWEDNWLSTPYCVGGIPPNYNTSELQYGIDVDTFIISATDPLFAPHLIPGDDHLWLKVSANQDLIYTNLLVLSIDTKRPKFDIPPNQDTPDGREKNYCSCAPDADAVCEDRPFYFTIKVENWGDNLANNVTVKDALPNLVNYIPGTTEMLVKKDGVVGQWEKIDDVGGQFPLTSPTKIADQMAYCDPFTFECQDSILIRFKVKPIDGIMKHQVIENTAVITDSSGIQYFSNSSVALRLRLGNCPSITECPEPSKEQCGGLGGSDQCQKDEDCDSGYTCSDGQCVRETANLTKDAVITFAEGLNSPKSEGSSIIIPNPSKDLVVAQFTLIAEGDKAKSFELNGLNLTVTKTENTTALTKFRLVHDKEGTGEVSKDDKTLATVETYSGNTVGLNLLDAGDRTFAAGTLHYFLVVLDAAHPTEVTSNVTFNVEISGKEAILARDSGKPDVKGPKIVFSKFRFEPANGFIVTKGLNDPEVPPIDQMRGMVPMLQIRTKSMQGDDTLRSIAIRPSARSVKFGEGIGKVALYLDTDNNGLVSAVDEKLGELSVPDGGYMTFGDLNIKYSKGEEKHFIIVAELKMKSGEMAQLQIQQGRVRLADTSKDIVELPVTSKEFLYECQDNDPRCQEISEPGGCGCTMISTDSSPFSSILAIFAFLSIIFSAFAFSFKRD